MIPPPAPRSRARQRSLPWIVASLAGLLALTALLRGTRGEAEARRSLTLRAGGGAAGRAPGAPPPRGGAGFARGGRAARRRPRVARRARRDRGVARAPPRGPAAPAVAREGRTPRRIAPDRARRAPLHAVHVPRR